MADTHAKGAAAVQAGSTFFLAQSDRMKVAAITSGDPMLFYAAYLGGLFGHMSAALGGDLADSVVEALRPTFVQAVRDCEGRRQDG